MKIEPKTVNLDCDGVLADLGNYFLDWLFQKYDGVRRTVEQIASPNGFTEALGLPPHVEDRFFAEVKPYGHCARLPAYRGAREFVAHLKSFGHEVLACTASSGAAWTGQRAEWLEREMGIPPVDQIICGKGRKPRVDADFLVEDSWKNAVGFVSSGSRAHRRAIVLDRPWNQRSGHRRACDGLWYPDTNGGTVARAKSYEEIVSLINGTLEWPR